MQIITIPCLSDNYAFLLHAEGAHAEGAHAEGEGAPTILIDAPEARPILETLRRHNWSLSHILLTHHHADHVDGLPAILAEHRAQVIGAQADAHRLPPLDRAVSEGDHLQIGNENVAVFDVSGHTVGHLAFYFPQTGAAATADSLMALGCGRLFEGTAAMMYDSLRKLAALPAETLILSGHEYTQSNARFAQTVDPENTALARRAAQVDSARAQGTPTVPSTLAEEKATNPYLRCSDPALQAALGMTGAPPAEVFAEVRRRKDTF